jgi:hypothetical protein
MALPGLAIPIVLGRGFGAPGQIAGMVLTVIYWVFLSVISSTVQGIFNVALSIPLRKNQRNFARFFLERL